MKKLSKWIEKRVECQYLSDGGYTRYTDALIDVKRYIEEQKVVLPQADFSGSFSAMELKWLLYYGKTSDRKDQVKIDNEGKIDFAMAQMFDLLEEYTVFDRKEIERIFWERIRGLANDR